MTTRIEIGDVVETFSTKRQAGKKEHELELAEVIDVVPPYPDQPPELTIRNSDGQVREIVGRVKRHWKPAATKKARGPLKQARKRDMLVLTEIVVTKVSRRGTLRAYAKGTVSDQLILSGFEIHQVDRGVEVRFPEGVNLVVPHPKLHRVWRAQIVTAYLMAGGV